MESIYTVRVEDYICVPSEGCVTKAEAEAIAQTLLEQGFRAVRIVDGRTGASERRAR